MVPLLNPLISTSHLDSAASTHGRPGSILSVASDQSRLDKSGAEHWSIRAPTCEINKSAWCSRSWWLNRAHPWKDWTRTKGEQEGSPSVFPDPSSPQICDMSLSARSGLTSSEKSVWNLRSERGTNAPG